MAPDNQGSPSKILHGENTTHAAKDINVSDDLSPCSGFDASTVDISKNCVRVKHDDIYSRQFMKYDVTYIDPCGSSISWVEECIL